MKILFLMMSFLFSSFSLFAINLKSGDVVVQSFDCGECRLIMAETNSPFVHSGVILKDSDGKLKVAEALGPVKLTDLNEFLARGRINAFYRAYDMDKLSAEDFLLLEKKMRELFNEKFLGSPFDSYFLWENKLPNGKEPLYCSELVTKLLNPFLMTKIEPQPMMFSVRYDDWYRILRGRVPVGEPGVSPAFFTRSNLFFEVKE